jgi:hypothetical protein
MMEGKPRPNKVKYRTCPFVSSILLDNHLATTAFLGFSTGMEILMVFPKWVPQVFMG